MSETWLQTAETVDWLASGLVVVFHVSAMLTLSIDAADTIARTSTLHNNLWRLFQCGTGTLWVLVALVHALLRVDRPAPRLLTAAGALAPFCWALLLSLQLGWLGLQAAEARRLNYRQLGPPNAGTDGLPVRGVAWPGLSRPMCWRALLRVVVAGVAQLVPALWVLLAWMHQSADAAAADTSRLSRLLGWAGWNWRTLLVFLLLLHSLYQQLSTRGAAHLLGAWQLGMRLVLSAQCAALLFHVAVVLWAPRGPIFLPVCSAAAASLVWLLYTSHDHRRRRALAADAAERAAADFGDEAIADESCSQ